MPVPRHGQRCVPQPAAADGSRRPPRSGRRFRSTCTTPCVPGDGAWTCSSGCLDAAIRTLEDTPILPASLLNQYGPEPSTFRPQETVELVCDPVSMQDLNTLWEIQKPSVPLMITYAARMVFIDSDVVLTEGPPVQVRVFDMAGSPLVIAAMRVLERLSRLTPLGLRFWDDGTGAVITDGLHVEIYAPERPNASCRGAAEPQRHIRRVESSRRSRSRHPVWCRWRRSHSGRSVSRVRSSSKSPIVVSSFSRSRSSCRCPPEAPRCPGACRSRPRRRRWFRCSPTASRPVPAGMAVIRADLRQPSTSGGRMFFQPGAVGGARSACRGHATRPRARGSDWPRRDRAAVPRTGRAAHSTGVAAVSRWAGPRRSGMGGDPRRVLRAGRAGAGDTRSVPNADAAPGAVVGRCAAASPVGRSGLALRTGTRRSQ